MPTFSDYKIYVTEVFSSVPQWPDVELLLDHIRDKPGAKFVLGDLMQILNTNDPWRAISATGILAGGALSILRPYFKIEAEDGTLHDVASIPKQCLDGELPYTLEATNEVIWGVGDRAFLAYEVAEF